MVELNRSQQFNDIIHGTIVYSGLESAIMSTPIFNRLHRILQNSLVYLTFSSNRVKRFEHSVGTMYLAGEMLYNSIVNTVDSDIKIVNDFLEEASRELKTWWKNIDTLHEKMISSSVVDVITDVLKAPCPSNALYRRYYPQNILEGHKFAYLVVFESIRIAALLHDVGHLPYSHIFEHTIDLLITRISEIEEKSRNKAQKQFLECFVAKESDSATDKTALNMTRGKFDEATHEKIGRKLLTQIKEEIANEVNSGSPDNVFILAVFYVVEKILCSELNENNIFADLHRIISGVLDADRLDYCSRDAFCTGMRKDIFPYERLMTTYRICSASLEFDDKTVSDRKHILFCPALKTLPLVEDLLYRRWDIFSRINFHHRVHKHETIFAEVLAKIGFKELEKCADGIPEIKPSEPIPMHLLSVWQVILMLKEANRSIDYVVIQLDDSWLDTLLKNKFFATYGVNYRNAARNGGNPDWNMFDELISTKKHYYSAFKRDTDFINFDYNFWNKWKEKHREDAGENTKEMNLSQKVASIVSEKYVTRSGSERPVLNDTSGAGAVLKRAFDTVFSELDTEQQNVVYQKVEEKINIQLSKNSTDFGIIHVLIRPCTFSLGHVCFGSPMCFWDKTIDNRKHLSQVSDIDIQLRRRKSLYVPFHVYYLPSGEPSNANLEKLEDTLLELFLDELDCMLSEQKNE